jgi:hypothetical protein
MAEEVKKPPLTLQQANELLVAEYKRLGENPAAMQKVMDVLAELGVHSLDGLPVEKLHDAVQKVQALV